MLYVHFVHVKSSGFALTLNLTLRTILLDLTLLHLTPKAFNAKGI